MRESLKAFKEVYSSRIVKAIEVGVADSRNARKIMDNLRIERLYLIDSWHSKYNKNCFKWLKKTSELWEDDKRIIIIKANSSEAYTLFQPESIDYIYVDGGHSYDVVKSDIDRYYPLVKKGGMLSGHDYSIDMPDRVFSAVNEFADRYSFVVHHMENNGEKVDDWWIWKR